MSLSLVTQMVKIRLPMQEISLLTRSERSPGGGGMALQDSCPGEAHRDRRPGELVMSPDMTERLST